MFDKSALLKSVATEIVSSGVVVEENQSELVLDYTSDTSITVSNAATNTVLINGSIYFNNTLTMSVFVF